MDCLHPDMTPSEGQAAGWMSTSVFIFQFQELGIKQPLHRKKLILAVKAINTKQEEKSALLDHIWVTRKDGQYLCMSLACECMPQRLCSPWERQLGRFLMGNTAGPSR